MKYKIHIPFGSSEELLRQAVESVRDIGNIHVWGNGCAVPDIPAITAHTPGLVSTVSLINMCIQESWNDDVMMIIHDDARAKEHTARRFLECVRHNFNMTERWGAVFSHYDVLMALNMTAVRDVGWWDTMFFQYTSDVDYYHRLRTNHWPILDSGLGDGVEHFGSSVVRTNKLFGHRTAFRNGTQFDYQYYAFKWGGIPGKETFSHPFQDFGG